MEFTKEKLRTLSEIGSRGTFGVAMMEVGAKNDNVFVITADLGDATRVSQFGSTYPDRYLNIGICEQNLVGTASGMALGGRTVVATTFAAFASMRACEQVRTDMGYMRTNVKLVGADGGVVMGTLGNTHYAVEDIGVLRSCPYLTILSPADGMEIVKATFAAIEMNGPVYIRLTGAKGLPIVYEDDFNYEIGKAVTLRDGSDVTLFGTGIMTAACLQAAEILEADGSSAAVVNIHTIKPIDREIILKAAEETRRIITVEDHTIMGGLGTAVGEVILEGGRACAFKKLGLNDCFSSIGFHEDLMSINGIDTENIVKTAIDMMKRAHIVEISADGKTTRALKFDDRDFEAEIDWTDEV
jgi:transketolase